MTPQIVHKNNLYLLYGKSWMGNWPWTCAAVAVYGAVLLLFGCEPNKSENPKPPVPRPRFETWIIYKEGGGPYIYMVRDSDTSNEWIVAQSGASGGIAIEKINKD